MWWDTFSDKDAQRGFESLTPPSIDNRIATQAGVLPLPSRPQKRRAVTSQHEPLSIGAGKIGARCQPTNRSGLFRAYDVATDSNARLVGLTVQLSGDSA